MIYKAVFYDVEVNTKNNEIFHTNIKTKFFSDFTCNFNPLDYCERFTFKNNLTSFKVYQLDKISVIDIFEHATLRVYYKFNILASSTSHYIYF